MLHKAWSSTEQVPYCFLRSSVKLQGHTAKKIDDFDLDWAFPDCNSSLNSSMAMKCCTKLETAKEICPIVFQGHPSNFKVTRDKTSPILTQIGRFRTIGRSQLSNPSDLPCWHCEGIHITGHGNVMMTSSNGNIFRVTGLLCGEFTVPGEFPAQRPVTQSFDVFFHPRLNKRLSKQPRGWWLETPPWSLWHQFTATLLNVCVCD